MQIIEISRLKKDGSIIFHNTRTVGQLEFPVKSILKSGLTVEISPRKRVTVSNIVPLRKDRAIVFDPKTQGFRDILDNPLRDIKNLLGFPRLEKFSLKPNERVKIISQTLDEDLELSIR